MASINWETQMSGKSTEEAWEILKKHLDKVTEEFVPKSTSKDKSEPKWLNREIIRLIRKKKRAWKIYKLHNSAESRDNYKSLVSEVTKKVRNAKRGMEKRLANSTENNNSRRFANYIKSKTKTRISVGPLKDQEGKLVTDKLEMAKTQTSFFQKCLPRRM